jgi:hypothetical protein
MPVSAMYNGKSNKICMTHTAPNPGIIQEVCPESDNLGCQRCLPRKVDIGVGKNRFDKVKDMTFSRSRCVWVMTAFQAV